MSRAAYHIKKYNALNGKYGTRSTVEKVLFALQKDITNRNIRKNDPLAEEVRKVQKRLIHLINAVNGNRIRIKFNPIPFHKEKAPAIPLGFVRADQLLENAPATFSLPGEMGRFLGNLQRYKLAISVTGDFHAGKSEFVKQLIEAFIAGGMTVGLFDLEQGGLVSKDTRESIDRNIAKKHQKNLAVTGETEKGLQTVKQYAKDFDVVVVDSWQKLGEKSTRFDELRNEYPNTIFVVIFQQNSEGGTRGGVSSDFDAPIALKANRIAPHDFTKNYVSIKKNRGNRTDLAYYIADKKTKTIEEITTTNQ